jgi:L-lactate dehydrogenase complex protein LldE
MKPRVGLFVTCLVDFFRPSVAFAAVRLLEDAGCEVVVPTAQTCCGQPAWNAGDVADARRLALGFLDAFAAPEVGSLDAIVAPSGSCIGMLRQFPEVIGRTDRRHGEAVALAERTHELTEYLVDVRGWRPQRVAEGLRATYHDSCAGLRECGIKAQPRALLEAAGAEVVEMTAPETCCGFGGTFCIKYPDISRGMVDDKIDDVAATGAPMLLAGDLGCLLNMAGRATRTGAGLEVRHVAEVLAGDLATPAIGAGEDER